MAFLASFGAPWPPGCNCNRAREIGAIAFFWVICVNSENLRKGAIRLIEHGTQVHVLEHTTLNGQNLAIVGALPNSELTMRRRKWAIAKQHAAHATSAVADAWQFALTRSHVSRDLPFSCRVPWSPLPYYT